MELYLIGDETGMPHTAFERVEDQQGIFFPIASTESKDE